MSQHDRAASVLPFAPPAPSSEEAIFGREDALARVQSAFASGAEVVTIWGPPGVGKTRLARALELLEPGRDVHVCRLAEISSPELLMGALAISLELAALEPGAGPERALEQLRVALAERVDALWIIDNAEHVSDALVEILASFSRRPRILITSRAPLGMPEEEWVELAPLEPGAAMELFVARARRVRPGFVISAEHAPTMEALIEELDRLPLAIELAASRLALLTPEQLLARMGQRFRLLRPGRAGASLGVGALEDAIDASWSQLTSELQEALAQMSVFEGSFSLEAVEGVLELEGDDDVWSGDLVEELLFRSMLFVRDHEPTSQRRYGMLLSVRDFARARLTDEEGARGRHARHYRALGRELTARRFGARGLGAVRIAEAEYANLRAAAEWAIEAGDEDAVMSMLDLDVAYVRGGDSAAYLRDLERAAPRFEASPERAARWKITRARLYRQLGDRGRALALCEEAAALMEGVGLEVSSEFAHIRATALLGAQRIELAEEVLEGALARADASRDEDVPLRVLLAWLVLGRADFRGGATAEELTRTRELLERPQAVMGDDHDALELSDMFRTLGLWSKLNGEADREDVYMDRAIEQVRLQRRWDQVAVCLSFRSHGHQRRGAHARALEVASEAVSLCSRAGLLSIRPLALYQLSNIASQMGQVEVAVRAAHDGVHASRETGASFIEVFQYRVLIGGLYELERYEELGRWLSEIGEREVALDNETEVMTRVFRALLDAREGDLDGARATIMTSCEALSQHEFHQSDDDVQPWEIIRDACLALVELEQVARWTRDGALELAQGGLERQRARLEELQSAVGSEHQLHEYLRLLGKRVEAWDERLPRHAVAHRLRVDAEGRWFEVDGEERVEVGHRETLRLLLARLVSEHPEGMSVPELVEAGWPGEVIEETSAANRVYAAVRTLRRLGLDGVLVKHTRGYCVGPDVYVQAVVQEP